MRSSPLVFVVGVAALGLVSASCSKKAEPPPANPLISTPAADAPPPSPVEREANTQLKDLQLQVDAYNKIYKRMPASLAQMVQEGFLPALPPAPAGKRFDYDPASGRVTLTP